MTLLHNREDQLANVTNVVRKRDINPKLMVWGYSVGSQMVSWFMQLHASGQLESLHLEGRVDGGSGSVIATGADANVDADANAGSAPVRNTTVGKTKVVAGVMFAGGSYSCFLDPPLALAQCSTCNASNECTTLGCSNEMVAKNRTPCCNYCCPENFTEQHYKDHPADYKTHPGVFLVQHTTVDENSDTCAALNYHNTMKAHGGKSELYLIPKNRETCYCVGEADDKSSLGSPYSKHCPDFLPGLPPPPLRPESRTTERCMMHALAFADAVIPATKFLIAAGYKTTDTDNE